MKKLLVDRNVAVLRETARALGPREIGSSAVREAITKMKKALHAEKDGVAIAAPQIGVSLRIFVVNGEIIKSPKDLVYINPEIVKQSQKKKKVEEGCLSLRYLYGRVKRHEKVSIKALDEKGVKKTYGASGLLAQIFQHEIDHLNGILFIDKAEDVRDLPPLSIVFFGSSRFSTFVLEELEKAGYSPVLNIINSKSPLPQIGNDIDLCVVASFGKILPAEMLSIPKYGFLNVHPSLLPELRGPAPIQSTILGLGKPAVTVIKMDGKMDHGSIVAQEEVSIAPWPDHYAKVEEKLGQAGGKLLAKVIPEWFKGEIKEMPQEESTATYTKLIKKEDGLIELNGAAEENLRKVLAYSTWPGAYMFFKNKTGKEIRIVIKDAEVKGGKFMPTRIIPAGKREMDWQDFLRGNA